MWAKTDDGIRGFVVPTDTKGFTATDIHRKLSLRASVTSELSLEDVRLPARRGPARGHGHARAAVVPDRGALRHLLGRGRRGRACYESALEYAKTRVQFGRPIAGFQLTQRKLVDMMLEIQKAQLLACGSAGSRTRASSTRARSRSASSTTCARRSRSRARRATILGANGITTEYPVMRHANNLESVLTYEGTSEIHTLILGEALTGERALM